MIKNWKQFNEEVEDKTTFNKLFKTKYEWVELSDSEKVKIKNNLYDLVSKAYSFDNGHVSITTPESIQNLGFWIAADINDDPFADVVIFGRKTSHGIKISGIGHNNELYSKTEAVTHLAEILNHDGVWGELSGKLADALLKNFDIQYVDNKEDVEKVLGKPITKWLGNGWYERIIEDGSVIKDIMVGKPLL